MAVLGFGGQTVAAGVSEPGETFAGIEPWFAMVESLDVESRRLALKCWRQVQLQMSLEDDTIKTYFDGSPIHRKTRNVTQQT